MVAVIGNIGYVSTNHYSFYTKLISSCPTLSSVSLPFISSFGGLFIIETLASPVPVSWCSGIPPWAQKHCSIHWPGCTLACRGGGSRSGTGPTGTPATCLCTKTTAWWMSQLLGKPSFLCYGKLPWVPENPIRWKKTWPSRYCALKKKFISRI